MSRTVPLLRHGDYIDPAVHAAETERVFGHSWLCLGLASAGLPPAMTVGGRAMAVARCGGLVFVHPEESPPPLEAWLAPYGAWLSAATAPLGTFDRTGRSEVGANWKLLVENTLDDCHVGTVHAASLQPSFPAWRAGMRQERHGANSDIEQALGPADLAYWERLDRRLRLARHGAGKAYRHVFIFPNLYLATFFDALVLVHRIEPLGPERSALEWGLALPTRAPPSGAGATVRRAVLDDLATQAERVIAEDLAICARAQRGRHFAVHPGVLGEREVRIADFQGRLQEMLRR